MANCIYCNVTEKYHYFIFHLQLTFLMLPQCIFTQKVFSMDTTSLSQLGNRQRKACLDRCPSLPAMKIIMTENVCHWDEAAQA